MYYQKLFSVSKTSNDEYMENDFHHDVPHVLLLPNNFHLLKVLLLYSVEI